MKERKEDEAVLKLEHALESVDFPYFVKKFYFRFGSLCSKQNHEDEGGSQKKRKSKED